MTGQAWLVPCGASKLDHAAPARELYTGAHFRWVLRTVEAAAQRAGARTLIVSARHGLVDPDQTLAPYDATLRRGRTDLRLAFLLRQQLAEQGISSVACFLPGAYLRAVDYAARTAAGPRVIVVDAFHGCRGIGEQRAVVAQLTSSQRALAAARSQVGAL